MIETKFHTDNGDLIVERIQDVEPILEANKRAFNGARDGWGGDFHHVASIPNVVIEKWCNEKGFTFADFMRDKRLVKRFLNDSENKFLRTRPGKI